MESYVLAIDLGSSGPKTAIVSESGAIAGWAFEPVRSIVLPDGGAEQDPEQTWVAVVKASKAAIAASKVAAPQIAAVICDSYFFSLVCLEKNGNPAMNMIFWPDRRGAWDQMKRFENFRPDSYWRQFQQLRIHGIPAIPTGMDDLAKFRWLMHARPEAYARTATFLEPMDYLSYRLTGRIATNMCSVFSMQLTDNRNLSRHGYDQRLIRYSGIDADKLPDIVDPHEILGEVQASAAEAIGLCAGTKVVSSVNDTQAAALGCGAFRGRHAGIVLGSSGVMVAHTPRKKTDIRTALFSMPSPVQGEYLMAAESGAVGRTFEHMVESILYGAPDGSETPKTDPYKQIESLLSESPPGSKGVLFLPWMDGANAPKPDGDVRGGFLNLSLDTRRADLTRAILEGIGVLYRQMDIAARRFTGREFSHFTLYGGGAQSDSWSQIMADVLQRPMHRMAQPRLTNCRGLGLLAFERLGRFGFDAFEERIPTERVFEPNPALRALYEDRFETMNLAFNRNRRVFRRLNSTLTEKR